MKKTDFYIVCDHLLKNTDQEWVPQGHNGYLCVACHESREANGDESIQEHLWPLAEESVKGLMGDKH
jgi:hypothetical protein